MNYNNIYKNFFYLILFIVCLLAYAEETSSSIQVKVSTDWQGDTKDIAHGELEMTLSTDQKSYFPGEPIILVIALHNRGDKVLRLGVTKPWICDYEITVFDPKRKGKTIPKEVFGAEADIVVPSHEPTPVPMTRWLQQFRAYGSKSFEINPKEKSLFFFPLHLAFDMTCPEGAYTVKVKYKPCHFAIPSFMLEGTTSVTIRSLYDFHMNSNYATAEYMIRMCGRRKTTHFLCAEAEALLASLEQAKEGELEDSAAYRRLILLLRTVMHADGRFSHSERVKFGLFDDEKHFTPEEVRELLKKIRHHIPSLEGVEEEKEADEDDGEDE